MSFYIDPRWISPRRGHALVRTACVLLLLGWIAGVTAFIGIGALSLSAPYLDQVSDAIFNNPVPLFAAIAVFYAAAAIVRFVWRCSFCSRRMSLEPSLWALDGSIQRPHFAAKRFLGSYATKAIVDMALHGHAACVWCGKLNSAPSTPSSELAS